MRRVEDNEFCNAIRIARGRPPSDEPAPIVPNQRKCLAPERIRQMLHAGELEGELEGETHASWKVYKASVDARRDRSRG